MGKSRERDPTRGKDNKHNPNDRTREQVITLIGTGHTLIKTAKMIGVSLPTLHKYYAEEIELGNNELETACYRTLTRNMTQSHNFNASNKAAETLLQIRFNRGATQKVEVTNKMHEEEQAVSAWLNSLSAVDRTAVEQALLEAADEDETKH